MSKVKGGQVYVEIGADPRKLFKALGDLNKSIGKIGASMTNLGARMTGIGAAIAAPIGLATRQFALFDDAIRATAAVSQASGADLQKLNDTARELGATTSFTAVQVANLMTELGRAGFKPDEINDMTQAVLDLARATGTDAALSAGIMAATLRQFGLGATDAARAADVLTKAANSTFNTVEGLGESLKYAGPVAKSLGLSLEETTAILGVLGNVGIQGSEAGTALRRLSVISAASGEELQKLFGISNTDAAGNLKPLVDILDEINTATANMPVAERTAKMAQAFGLLGITSANVLSSSADGVRGLADSLRNAEGTAAKTAKEMDAGLGGALRITLSAVEGTALAIGDALAPSLQKLLEGITAVAGGLTKFVKDNEALIVSAAKGIAIFTGVGLALIGLGSAIQVVSFGMGGLLSAVSMVVVPFTSLIATLGGLVASFASAAVGAVAYAATSAAAAAASGAAWAIANAPLLALLAVLGGIGVYFVSLTSGFDGLGASIKGGFSAAVSGASTLLGGLWEIAKETFLGIRDAIAFGDLQGAMEIAMAGVVAAFTKATNALMTQASKTMANIINTLDAMQAFASQPLMAFEWIKDPIVEADRQALRKRQDERLAKVAQDEAVRNAAAAEKVDRLPEVRRNVSGRNVRNDQFTRLLKDIEGATSMDALRGMYEEYDALASGGRLTSGQTSALEAALEDAQERVSKATSSMGGTSPSQKIRGGAAAAVTDPSPADAAGTFSSMALGGLGIGSSLAQKQLDALRQIEENTRPGDDGLVAA